MARFEILDLWVMPLGQRTSSESIRGLSEPEVLTVRIRRAEPFVAFTSRYTTRPPAFTVVSAPPAKRLLLTPRRSSSNQ